MLINHDFSVDRSKYIGGSDIGAILGLSKFRTPLEVWMEKTGKEVKQLDFLPLRFGSFVEEFVASEYSRSTGYQLLHDESIYIHPTHSFMSAHIDRFILGDGECKPPTRILECKTANPFAKGEWGEPGTDQVPMSYLCQCIWYMAITGIEQCDLAVLFGNSDFRIYEIARDLELETLVIEKAQHFWNEYVLKDHPPPGQTEGDYQFLYQKSDPTKTIEANSETVEIIKQLNFLNSEIDAKEQEISRMKQLLMERMGEAEILNYQDQILATWKKPKLSYRLDTKKLELEHGELCKLYKVVIQNNRRLIVKAFNSDKTGRA